MFSSRMSHILYFNIITSKSARGDRLGISQVFTGPMHSHLHVWLSSLGIFPSFEILSVVKSFPNFAFKFFGQSLVSSNSYPASRSYGVKQFLSIVLTNSPGKRLFTVSEFRVRSNKDAPCEREFPESLQVG